MKNIRALASLSLACLMAPALGAGSNPVASDTKSNSAMGTSALLNTLNNPSSGQGNTAAGYGALQNNTAGNFNTAFGTVALQYSTGGYGNTAIGFASLISNTSGNQNTATGMYSLYSGYDGYANTANGFGALFHTNHGNDNSAIGIDSMYSNTTGSFNVANGSNALRSNVDGGYNSATGWQALYSNLNGYYNTANGEQALYANTSGFYNTAQGGGALRNVTGGWGNTAVGMSALFSITTGTNNIGIGNQAGFNVSGTGSDNIEIGTYGAAGDNRTIRLGSQGQQTITYVAGIYGTPMTGAQVVVNSNGQLGVIASSERFKTDIRTIASEAERLERLRPVTFRLKSDPKGALQYGLIAEEVAQVYPDLVVRDQNGRIDSVRYDEIAPLLLRHLQLERRTSANRNGELERKLTAQQTRIDVLERQVNALRASLPPGNHDSLVADAH